MELLGKFGHDRLGNIGVTFILMTAAVTTAVAVGVETARVVSNQHVMQNVSDSAALYGATLLSDASLSDADLSTRVQRWVAAQVLGSGLTLEESGVSVVIDRDAATIQVSAEAGFNVFIPAITLGKAQTVAATSKAGAPTTASGGGPGLCALSLNASRSKAMHLIGDGEIDAGACVFWSNSTKKDATEGVGDGDAVTTKVCSVGKFAKSGTYKILPPPEDNCAALADPLADWNPPAPDWARCDFGGAGAPLDIDGGGYDVSLRPGVYCGGLSVANARNITLAPGRYFFDGDVSVEGSGTISGDTVYLHYSPLAESVAMRSARLSLTAASDAELRSIVSYKDPASLGNAPAQFEAKTAFYTNGAWYFPADGLDFRIGLDPAADKPKISVIAGTVSFRVEGGSRLALTPLIDLPEGNGPSIVRKSVQLLN